MGWRSTLALAGQKCTLASWWKAQQSCELSCDMHRWRYVDPQAQTQGPFPARTMLEWYRRGLLNDMSLQTCGGGELLSF